MNRSPREICTPRPRKRSANRTTVGLKTQASKTTENARPSSFHVRICTWCYQTLENQQRTKKPLWQSVFDVSLSVPRASFQVNEPLVNGWIGKHRVTASFHPLDITSFSLPFIPMLYNQITSLCCSWEWYPAPEWEYRSNGVSISKWNNKWTHSMLRCKIKIMSIYRSAYLMKCFPPAPRLPDTPRRLVAYREQVTLSTNYSARMGHQFNGFPLLWHFFTFQVFPPTLVNFLRRPEAHW